MKFYFYGQKIPESILKITPKHQDNWAKFGGLLNVVINKNGESHVIPVIPLVYTAMFNGTSATFDGGVNGSKCIVYEKNLLSFFGSSQTKQKLLVTVPL